MQDTEIVDLYWKRDEEAIRHTDEKYGRYCLKIAGSILYSREDSEECVNDTYVQAWNSIPPARPEKLSTYLGKICRNIAINLYEKLTASKRGGCQTDSCLDELTEILSSPDSVDDAVEMDCLTDAINSFLKTLSEDARRVFVRRYWYMSSVKEISDDYGMSESKVKMTLLRTRDKMKDYLVKEGFDV